jgi:hypothetical protein
VAARSRARGDLDRREPAARSQAGGREAQLEVQPQAVLRPGDDRLRHHHPGAGVSRQGRHRARVDPPPAVVVGHVGRRGGGGGGRRGVGEHGRRGGHGRGGGAAGREHAAVGDVELLALRPARDGGGARGEVDPARGRRVAAAAAEEVRRRREGGHHRVGARVERGGPARDPAGGGRRGLQLRALELLPLLLVRVLVAAQRLRVGELAAAVLALVPPPVAGRRGRGRGGGRRRGGVRPPAAAAAVAARRRLLLLGRLRPQLVLLLGDVEAEEL